MIDSELKYHTGFNRLVAALIDGVVLNIICFICIWLVEYTQNQILIIIFMVIYVFIPIFYSVYLHALYGQTLGKIATKIKVIDFSELRNISLNQAILRDLFYIIITIGSLIYIFFKKNYQPFNAKSIIDEFENYGATITLFWVGLELLTMMTNYKKRAVHDYIANTVVIRV